MKRVICDEPICCEHCGIILDEFIEYVDFCGYCSSCTYANGDIDETQVKTDHLANLKLYKQYLLKELKETDEKIAEFFGHTLDNED